MQWINATEKQSEYNVPVLAFVGCTCESGQEKFTHKLDCMFHDFYIATWCQKDKQLKEWYDTFPEKKPYYWKYEDFWSPVKTDFWMPLPSKPEYKKDNI